jgi:hypothetical protein
VLRTRLTLVAVALLAFAGAVAGCGGGDGGDGGDNDGGNVVQPLPLEERVLQAGELEGATVGKTTEWSQAGAFARSFRIVDPTQLAQRLEAAGFVAAAGNELTYPDGRRHPRSFAVRLGSATAAAQLVDWLYQNAAAPCPPGCGVRSRPHDLAGVPASRAVEVFAGKKTVVGAPFQAHYAFFADGPFLYTVTIYGGPKSTKSGDVARAVGLLYERVKGRPDEAA